MAVSSRLRVALLVMLGFSLAAGLLGPAVAAAQADGQVEAFVIGGRPVTDPNRWPSIVSLYEGDAEAGEASHYCGGTVLTPNWVLTAAHCFWNEEGGPDVKDEAKIASSFVRAGSLSSSSGGTAHRVVDIRFFTESGVNNFRGVDIALVQVEPPMTAPAVALPTANPETHGFAYPPATGFAANDGSLWVAGWGATEDAEVSEVLREASISFYSHEACDSTAPDAPEAGKEICAGEVGPAPADACAGDSGGPLFRIVDGQVWQLGLVSRGDDCGFTEGPGTYTWTPFWLDTIVQVTGYVVPQPGGPAPPAPFEPLDVCPPEEMPASGLADIAGNSHQYTIECVVWHGIAQGTSPTTYSPRNAVNRAQMASFIARTVEAAGAALPAGEDQFHDVAGNVHRDNIESLAVAGIVQGVGGGAYAPGATVTRAQMASFLARAFAFVNEAPLPDAEAPFTDIAGNPHEDNIRRVAGAGFARGTSPTTYSPRGSVRRDQMASFLARMLDRFAADGRVSQPS